MPCTLALSACISLWLTAHGYEPAQRDAVLQQLWTESRFEPCVVASSGASYLPQWAGVRLRRVKAIFGPGCPSWDKQMEMIDWELRNEPSYQAFWSARPGNAFKVLRMTFGKGQQYDG
jgi:hypothetical protein